MGLAIGLVAGLTLLAGSGLTFAPHGLADRMGSSPATFSSTSVGAASEPTPATAADPSYGVVGHALVQIGPGGPVYDSGVAEVFTACYNSNSVSVYSDADRSIVANITGFHSPAGLAYDPSAGEIFVADYENPGTFGVPAPAVVILSDHTDQIVGSITVGYLLGGYAQNAPLTLAYDGSGAGSIWATVPQQDNVSLLSLSTDAIAGNVTVGEDPVGVVYDSARGEAFVANYDSNNVSVLTASPLRVVATIAVGADPDAIVYDAATGDVYVTDSGSANVSVISDTTDRVVASIPVGQDPRGAAVSWPGTVAVANSVSANVSVISTASNTVIATVAIGQAGYNFTSPAAFDSGTQQLVVTDEYYNAIWFVAPEFEVTIGESGLAGTFWGVQLTAPPAYPSFSGALGTTATELTISLPAGSFSFRVLPVVGFAAGPGAGAFTVVDAPVTVGLVFSEIYAVTFEETGLPIGTSWGVIFGGTQVNTTGASVEVPATNGSYGYRVLAPGWSANSEGSGSVTVSGGGVTVLVTFSESVPPAPGSAAASTSSSGYSTGDMVAIGLGAAGLALGLVGLVLALRRPRP